MKLIRSTNFWNCTLAAAAMVMDTTIEELEELIGHNGSEIINPSLKSPANRKGFHMQEIIDAAMVLDYAVVPIEAKPIQTPDGTKFNSIKLPESRFQDYLNNYKGIIQGARPNGVWHSVAWDSSNVYDPSGKIYGIKDINIKVQLFWIFIKSISK